ncbi:phage integrase family protein [Variovorax sp. J22R24]|uniref:site-specific integrase n=1 Tax=Variovorax gracilis TaxID=3053502 RepID=UPI0025772C92|nr:site-specific integrase [Variovorax sp. J22R24]MDM0108498.1 phage integrase family protein [Variovorax sp. J22R24]
MRKAAPVLPRKLHGGHFAFMRALAQGLDERASWDRYLRLEGEHADLRTVRRTIAWIRDEFAAAARRENKPGTARLILLDPDRFAAAPKQPTLAEFAAERGLEDFSEAEQLEAYEEAYPPGGQGGRGKAAPGRGGQGGAVPPTRRSRVIARQLEALRWLQDLVAQDPRPGDRVSAWLNPTLAKRLERAGVTTLLNLVERINGIGARWWVPVPGVGELKASRVLEWLQANEAVLGLRVGRHVLQPRSQLTPVVLAGVVPAATALRPFEKFLVPPALDGRAGGFRAPLEQSVLLARNDPEAIGAWLASKSAGRGNALSATQRAYRKEAERLLLWAVLERQKALSSLTVEDVNGYRSFLADPPAAWCGPRHHQRWSPLWRPLEGPLSAVALRHALTILKGLFAFLMSQGYVTGNPFAAFALPSHSPRPLGSRRTLTFSQWDHIEALLDQQVDTEAGRRLRRAMRWLYATGLRLAEITSVKCEDLEKIDYRATDGTMATDWMLSVVGKGGRSREVPIPRDLVDELGDELARHGFEREVSAPGNRGIRVMARFHTGFESGFNSDFVVGLDTGPQCPLSWRPVPWSASGLYQAIKAFLAHAADSLEGSDAQHLKEASTHWLRHSHASHALQGRAGQTPVPLQVVQNNLGHASVGTTSLYLMTERDERIRAMRGFWHSRGAP